MSKRQKIRQSLSNMRNEIAIAQFQIKLLEEEMEQFWIRMEGKKEFLRGSLCDQ